MESTFSPVFVIGTGRCGSTMLHDALCLHPQLDYLTQWVNRYPSKPQLNRYVMVLRQYQCFDYLVEKCSFPAEPYRFFEHGYKGFSEPYRDLFADDLRTKAAEKFRQALINSATGRPLLVKYTGWPRVGLMQAIFPAARFIHIVRDGRAVVSSVLEAPFFDGWSGPSRWTRGELSQRQMKAWKDSGESFVMLAAIGWENRLQAFESALSSLDQHQLLQFKYEDYCDNPVAAMQKIMTFLELPDDSNHTFMDRVAQQPRINTQHKWRDNFTELQQAQLSEYLQPLLARYGYQT